MPTQKQTTETIQALLNKAAQILALHFEVERRDIPDHHLQAYLAEANRGIDQVEKHIAGLLFWINRALKTKDTFLTGGDSEGDTRS